MDEFKTVRELYETCQYGDTLEKESIGEVTLDGWVRTNRDNGSVGFIEFNDGTYFKNAQLVYSKEMTSNYEECSHISFGSAIHVEGKFVLTPNNKQPFEIQVTNIKVEGTVAEDYPMQKKRHSFEFLREIAHLRPRANTFNAVFRVRSVLSMAIHEFFQSQGFVYVHSPIITGNDAEGAGECFRVVTDLKKPDDFFGKPASLSVSGQLQVEAFALTYRDVYTFGPTFRAEKSNTTRHAAEFWMIEPEIAFADLEDDMNLIEDCIKFCINYVKENCAPEIEFFNNMIDKSLIERLEQVASSSFKRMSYTEGIEVLKKAVADGHKFENPDIHWGMDLQSEHERYITEQVVKGPVFLTDYPKDIKAFYMRLNDDGKTVAACDLLVPYVGELVGGSQREERYDVLENRMKELGMNIEPLQWYLDLRKYGGCQHAGFGIGFDRLLMYLTGMENIRDVQPFPRTTNNLKY
ncbi:MAG: asparagine--tRNA ligase [Bacilli bacterium]|nr:asparagine--tRNA ligase [Bacilli bacterium]